MNTNPNNDPARDNTTVIADIATATETKPVRTARRNGKIARLPKKLRDLINQLLDDGLTYADILERLQQATDPPLPYPLSERNISTWHQGGYQDFLKFRETLDLLSLKLDRALDLVREAERSPGHIQSLTRSLAAIRLCEFLSQFSIGSPEAGITDYTRLVSAFSRFGKEAVQAAKLQLELEYPDQSPSPDESATSPGTTDSPHAKPQTEDDSMPAAPASVPLDQTSDPDHAPDPTGGNLQTPAEAQAVTCLPLPGLAAKPPAQGSSFAVSERLPHCGTKSSSISPG